ncbi:MAG: hypothetical protein PHP95_02755 [Desulfuromonadaceae bacterium]|nr:hypothetical protein [Desulfuromonadaceae bacterium]
MTLLDLDVFSEDVLKGALRALPYPARSRHLHAARSRGVFFVRVLPTTATPNANMQGRRPRDPAPIS